MDIRGIITFYIDCGQLELSKVDALIAKNKDDLKNLIERLQKQGVECVWMPTRSGHTRVEWLSLV